MNDRSSAIAAGFLSWHEISGFGPTSIRGQSFISVDVKDVDAYLARLPVFKSMMLRANRALGYPPISLTLQTADRSLEEVLEAMTFYRQVSLETLSPESKVSAALGHSRKRVHSPIKTNRRIGVDILFISSGAGAFALLFFGGFQFLTWLIFRFLPYDHYTYGIPIACLVSALCTWVVGKKLNGRTKPPRHTIYQVRMEYWGIIFGVLTLWLWWSYL